MVTDLVEIRRLGTLKAAENVAFRRYLSAHHRPPDEFQRLAAEFQRRIDCTSCANCCRNSVVAISPEDIRALGAALRLPDEEAMRRYTEPNPAEPGRRMLQSPRGECVFLIGNLCSVYGSRPKACREFPHLWPGCHSLGGRMSSICRWAALCPVVYNALEAYKRVAGYRPCLRAARAL